MRAALVAVMLVAPACDRVFGLERSIDAPAADVGAPDSDGDTVTGTWRYAYATNTANGTPAVIEMPHPDGHLSLQFDLDDEPFTVPLDPDGNFSFTRPPGASYRLTRSSEIEGGAALEMQMSAAHLDLKSRMAGRPDRAPVTQPTFLTFNANPTGDVRIIASTGLWTETQIQADALDWQTALSAAGPLGLLDAAKNDRLYYLNRRQYASPTGALWTAFSGESSAPVTLTDGMITSVPIAPVTTTHDRCVNIVARRSAQMARAMTAGGGSGISTTGSDWVIRAVPSVSQLGAVGAITLAFDGQSNGAVTDATLQATYRNPFPGHDEYASMGAGVVRDLYYAGAFKPAQLPIGERFYVPVVGCPGTMLLDATVGIPATPALDGVQLGLPEGNPIAVPAHAFVTLTWTLAAPGPTDLAAVTLYEVGIASGVTTLTPVRTFQTVTRSVKVPSVLINDGAYYVFRIDAGIGLPNAASGDLATIAFPLGNATQWSHMFQAISQ